MLPSAWVVALLAGKCFRSLWLSEARLPYAPPQTSHFALWQQSALPPEHLPFSLWLLSREQVRVWVPSPLAVHLLQSWSRALPSVTLQTLQVFGVVQVAAAQSWPVAGGVRAVRQLYAAALAVGVAGIALLGAGGGLGVLDLCAAVMVLRIKLTPLVDVSIRSLVVAGAAVLVVHSLRAAGGRRLQVHIARTEGMIALVSFPFLAVEAAKPVAFGVPFYGGIRAPFPRLREAMSAIVLSAAAGACARRDTGRGAVAAAVLRVDRIAAIALAGAGVGLVVALGLPRAPVVAQLPVFIAAFLADFSRGASHCAVIAASVMG